MADSKISNLNELATAPDAGDLFVIVDVSDTSMSASGTTKKIQSSNVTISDASTTVKGKVELATDAETITGTDAVRAITPSNLTAKIDTDGTLAGNLDTRIPSQKAVKTYAAPLSEFITGWHAAGETPTYASIDSPTGVITVASGAKTKYPIGSKIKFDQSQALTSYWSFDANSNDGVGSNNGTDTSMSYTAGKFSNAATFNGTTSKIVISDAASLKPTGEFTIGGWFKTSNTGALKALFASFAGLTNYAGILLEITSGNKLGFTSSNNTGSSAGVNFTSLVGATTVTDNAWHYVVVTFRNNFAQVYLDGNLEVSGYCLTPAYQATNYVRIGCEAYTGTDSQFMNGQIDDLYLINGYALDQDTIKAKYDAGTAQGTGSITVNKKGIVTATTDTTVTAYYGTDYTLANAAISSVYYSHMKAPLGFPINPTKWTVKVTDTTQRNVAGTGGTYNNIGTTNAQITFPIGVWNFDYQVFAWGDRTTAGTSDSIFVTLSTTNNTATDLELTSRWLISGTAANQSDVMAMLFIRSKTMVIAAKTLYYLNMKMDNSGTWYYDNANATMVLRAVCAYL